MASKCTEVTPLCPVEYTTLGYYPNKPLNIFCAAAFGVAMVIQLVVCVWKKTWAFSSFIVAGCALEVAGYAARVPLAANPWNSQAFQTQICAIILAPTLICISIYLTLKHLTLTLNPSLSRIRPKWLPFIFVPADVTCLLVQAIGGALAASGGSENRKLVDDGNRAIIAGIALQVVVLLCFGALSLDYWLRAKKWVHSADVTPAALALWNDKKFRTFGVAEMAGGWGNVIMQDEPSFAVLDSFMVLICVYLLSCFPPGIYFPQMAKGGKSSRNKSGTPESAGEESQDIEQGGLAGEEEPKEGHSSKPES
ncbi:hypothetical protein J7T55_004896 [Diaporthe amygdali]|uniref:uncharacterized protein n=1 Tax=Phomopsis amygdali TaxID=1214568 RepID=UPI0022FDCDDE|nr:uncharacterized protein J7T55_004896 [Diaporthe amygdali]KAJ0114652.1 hypothetical protein J7T55_004896 [Diaporthe amygdali]